MNNNSKLIFTLLMAFVLQLSFTTTTFAQSEKQLQSKCDRCAEYKKNNDMDSYIKEDCRIISNICNLLERPADTGPVILGTNDTMAVESTKTDLRIVSGANIPIFLILDGFEETHYNVTPKVSVLDKNKKVIYTPESLNFQQYLFKTGENRVKNVKGIKSIKKLEKDSKRILTTSIKMPKISTKSAYIKVDFETTHPATGKVTIVESLIKKVNIK